MHSKVREIYPIRWHKTYLCPMIQHGKTLISEELLEEVFVCDLNTCKGACCVEGSGGAPLNAEEVEKLKAIWPAVKTYLPEENQREVEAQGISVIDWDGEQVTPLRKGAECVYTLFDEDGTAKCGIERAYLDGKIDFKKPISCHAYPVRITEYEYFDALNYHRWSICSAACTLGEALKVPVFRFVKDGLIRKYGEDWYAELELIFEHWKRKDAPDEA